MQLPVVSSTCSVSSNVRHFFGLSSALGKTETNALHQTSTYPLDRLEQIFTVYWSSKAAVTKYHRLRRINNRFYFFTVLEARSLRSSCYQGWFWVKPLFLAYRWLLSCCVLTQALLTRTPILLD